MWGLQWVQFLLYGILALQCTHSWMHRPRTLASNMHKSALSMSTKADLTSNNVWSVSLRLEEAGCNSSIATGKFRFVESRGYEPPQGRVYVENDYNGFFKTDEQGFCGRWLLSEDKNDRKDGLWVCKFALILVVSDSHFLF